MDSILPFVIVGLTTGSVYGLAAVGLVLTYKTSGIFNFAHGSIGAMAVFIFYDLNVERGMSWPLAGFICLGLFAPLAGLGLERMARALDSATVAMKIVATIGLLLMVVGIGNIWYGGLTKSFPRYLPTESFEVGSVFIGYDQLIIMIVSLLATAMLYAFFRWSRLGYAMRGVVDDPDLLAMTGENPNRVRRVSWIVGAMFASLSGLLIAPNLSLSSIILVQIVIQAFAAAAIGYFSSLPLTYLGGLIVGVATALTSKYTSSIQSLSGLATGLPFIILFVVLILTPKSRLAQMRLAPDDLHRPSWYAPGRVRIAALGGVLFLLALVPQIVGVRLATWSLALTYVIMFLSLGLLVKTSGQVSLCHAAFAAVGAAGIGHFTDMNIPWLASLLLAGFIAIPVGAFVAVPAIRLSGVYLALATFGFGVFMANVLYTSDFMFGQAVGGLSVSRPDVAVGAWDLRTDEGFYYVLLIFTVLISIAVHLIQRSRLGRLLRGLADSPLALETHGATLNVTRVLVFCISAFIAAIAGGLIASTLHFASSGQFSYLLSLQLVALLVIVIAGEPWYALLAAFGFVILPAYIQTDQIFNYLTIVFGFFAATVAMTSNRAPRVPMALRTLLDRVGGREPTALLATGGVVPVLHGEHSPTTPSNPVASLQDRNHVGADAGNDKVGLRVTDLTVRFGGVVAVEGLSFSAPGNTITGLIGPNGAGKTTTFGACTGLVKPNSGTISLDEADLSRLSPPARARHGLGRTFQRPELFPSLTVRENVALGAEAPLAGANPLTQLVSRRSEVDDVRTSTDEALELAGIAPLSHVQAGTLSTGQRRLVELARVLAGPFSMLLLDEPSSGLNASETERFGDILLQVTREGRAGVVLVEHDMALVLRVCSQIYVLDFGRLIFQGTPEELAASELVRAAYLGSSAMGIDTQPDQSALNGSPAKA